MCEKGVCSKNSKSTKQTEEARLIYAYHQKMKAVWFGAAVQDRKVVATNFSFEEELGRLLNRLPYDVPFQVTETPNQLLTDVLKAIEEIFNGKDRESYEFKMVTDHLSSYTRRVLDCTSLVPVGYVTTYGALANVTGRIARSVGSVEASNPFPLLVPCHRVVRSDLSLGGYGYGTQVKLEILRREERGYKEPRVLEVDGGELSLFPAEQVKQTVI
jgi:methylated-DNA-[protein]-cysteine S-methyltransferase